MTLTPRDRRIRIISVTAAIPIGLGIGIGAGYLTRPDVQPDPLRDYSQPTVAAPTAAHPIPPAFRPAPTRHATPTTTADARPHLATPPPTTPAAPTTTAASTATTTPTPTATATATSPEPGAPHVPPPVVIPSSSNGAP